MIHHLPFEVQDANGTSHGRFATLDDARACVESDGLRDYTIWRQDTDRVSVPAVSTISEFHHTKIKVALTVPNIEIIANLLEREALRLEELAKSSSLAGTLNGQLLREGLECRLLHRRLRDHVPG